MRAKTDKQRGNSRACDSMGRALTAAGLPADADGRLPVVTVTGGSYVRVEHHRGILQFTDSCVRLYTVRGIIRITGKGLVSSRMDGEEMLIEGKISQICFE